MNNTLSFDDGKENYCYVCNKPFISQKALNTHYKTKGHEKNKKLNENDWYNVLNTSNVKKVTKKFKDLISSKEHYHKFFLSKNSFTKDEADTFMRLLFNENNDIVVKPTQEKKNVKSFSYQVKVPDNSISRKISNKSAVIK